MWLVVVMLLLVLLVLVLLQMVSICSLLFYFLFFLSLLRDGRPAFSCHHHRVPSNEKHTMQHNTPPKKPIFTDHNISTSNIHKIYTIRTLTNRRILAISSHAVLLVFPFISFEPTASFVRGAFSSMQRVQCVVYIPAASHSCRGEPAHSCFAPSYAAKRHLCNYVSHRT